MLPELLLVGSLMSPDAFRLVDRPQLPPDAFALVEKVKKPDPEPHGPPKPPDAPLRVSRNLPAFPGLSTALGQQQSFLIVLSDKKFYTDELKAVPIYKTNSFEGDTRSVIYVYSRRSGFWQQTVLPGDSTVADIETALRGQATQPASPPSTQPPAQPPAQPWQSAVPSYQSFPAVPSFGWEQPCRT